MIFKFLIKNKSKLIENINNNNNNNNNNTLAVHRVVTPLPRINATVGKSALLQI